MFKLIKSESKPLTQELAKQFSTMEISVAERPVNQTRLKHLRQKAEEGLLVSFNWSKAKLDDKYIRINGQHSSTVLSEMNGSFPQGLIVHLDEYEVDSNEDLAKLFRQFDDRKSSRSIGDIAGVYQSIHPELNGIPKPIAKLGIEGYAWYRRSLAGIYHPAGDDIYVQFANEGVQSFLIWLETILTAKALELRNKEVVAAMFQSWYMNKEVAQQFWTDVASDGVGLDDESPELVLGTWLKLAKEKELKDTLKPGQVYQGSAYAWHAMRNGKTIKEIKYDIKKGLNEIK
jgi:hypothetical protein